MKKSRNNALSSSIATSPWRKSRTSSTSSSSNFSPEDLFSLESKTPTVSMNLSKSVQYYFMDEPPSNILLENDNFTSDFEKLETPIYNLTLKCTSELLIRFPEQAIPLIHGLANKVVNSTLISLSFY